MKELKRFYSEYKDVLLWGVVLWVAWQMRGLFNIFGTAGDTLAGAVASATASAQQSSKEAKAKVQVKAVNPTATTAQVNTFITDAHSLAAALGKLPGVYTNSVIADVDSAMTVCKRYSKYLYRAVNGKPVYLTKALDGKTTTLQSQAATRKPSLQLPVLYELYKEVTGGSRSLIVDLDAVFDRGTFGPYTDFWKKFIRP